MVLKTGFKWIARLLAFILLVFFIPVGCALTSHLSGDEGASDWRTARRDSAGIAPDAATHQEALIQVYAARAFRWRGALGVHTWIAAKPQGADHYTRFEVIGFSVRRGGDAVQVAQGIPDGYWYGSQPTLLREIRGGDEVDALISRLHDAARLYPYNESFARSASLSPDNLR